MHYNTLKEYNDAQRHEMEVHKWLESEKAGHDLGEAAIIDWVKNGSAAKFAKENSFGDNTDKK